MRLIARRLADNHNAGTTRVSRINNGLCASRRTCRIIVSAFFYREIFINITRTRLSRFFILMQQKASRLLLRRGIDYRDRRASWAPFLSIRDARSPRIVPLVSESQIRACLNRVSFTGTERCAAEASSDRSLRNLIRSTQLRKSHASRSCIFVSQLVLVRAKIRLV